MIGVYLLHRYWLGHRKPRPDYPPVRWGLLYWLALLAALSHLLLDYTTAYGIRLFEPFNYRWYSWDIMFIIEPVMLAVLILGLALPWLFGLINQEVGARNKGPGGRGGAIFALLCIVVLWGYRDFQHRRALNAMSAITYNGAEATRIAAYPYWVNPYRWLGVVETAGFFQTLPVDSSRPEVDSRGRSAHLLQAGRDGGHAGGEGVVFRARVSRLGGVSRCRNASSGRRHQGLPGGL